MDVNGLTDLNKGNLKYIRTPKVVRNLDWDEYLKHYPGQPAPEKCFYQNKDPPVNEFQLNQKIEVSSLDHLKGFVHLATVVGLLGPRLQIRLDGCDNSNDFYELVDSDSINPVGTHETKKQFFAAPLRYRKDAASYKSFVKQALKNAPLAPQSAFKSAPKRPEKNFFEPGMKLEAVDLKHPSNICPATIQSVNQNLIQIHLDGWDSTNDYESNYLSRNLFPVGWCKKTGHILQYPGPKINFNSNNLIKEKNDSTTITNESSLFSPSLSEPSSSVSPETKNDLATKSQSNNHKNVKDFYQSFSSESNNSPTIGKVSFSTKVDTVDKISSVTSTASENHKSDNFLNVKDVFNDEMKPPASLNSKKTLQKKYNSISNHNDNLNNSHFKNDSNNISMMNSYNDLKTNVNSNEIMNNNVTYQEPKKNNKNQISKKIVQNKRGIKRTVNNQPKSIDFNNDLTFPKINHANDFFQQQQILNGDKRSPIEKYHSTLPNRRIISGWSVEQLIQFLNIRLPEFFRYENLFRNQEIDGEAFLMLTHDLIMKHMNLKLGYSLKIIDLIDRINSESF